MAAFEILIAVLVTVGSVTIGVLSGLLTVSLLLHKVDEILRPHLTRSKATDPKPVAKPAPPPPAPKPEAHAFKPAMATEHSSLFRVPPKEMTDAQAQIDRFITNELVMGIAAGDSLFYRHPVTGIDHVCVAATGVRKDGAGTPYVNVRGLRMEGRSDDAVIPIALKYLRRAP